MASGDVVEHRQRGFQSTAPDQPASRRRGDAYQAVPGRRRALSEAESIAAKGRSPSRSEVWRVVGIAPATKSLTDLSCLALVGRDERARTAGRGPGRQWWMLKAGGALRRWSADAGHREEPSPRRVRGARRPRRPACTIEQIPYTVRRRHHLLARRPEMVNLPAGILESDDRPTHRHEARRDSSTDFGSEDPDELRTIAAALSNVIGLPDQRLRANASPQARLRRVSCTGACDRPLQLIAESKADRSSCSRTSNGLRPR